MNVVVWNEFKVSMYCDNLEKGENESKYDFLQRVEDGSGNISSVIEVNDRKQLKDFLEAVHNETDIELSYQIIDEQGQPIKETPPSPDVIAA